MYELADKNQEIRRIFESKIETETDSDHGITAVPYNPRFARNPRASGPRPRSNQTSFKKLGGDYLHFTLYKENKDTMDAVNQISRMTRMKANGFGFAGTKDRRAATVQRMSAYRVRHQTLDFLNSQIPAMKMGDYKYSQYPIQLGDHGGNEFKITVKNVTVTHGDSYSLERRVQLTKQAVETAVSEITKYGFINYYGLQRFGTHVIGTHELGKMMLMEDYEAVVDALLHVDGDFMTQVISGTVQETPSNRDEINRVRAIVQFKTAKDAKAALQIMPKRFGAETNVIQHLAKNSRDFPGAILTITRGMRNLYLHAYQSYIWNHAASYRWAKYGSKVIPGDLVLVTPENTAIDNRDGGFDGLSATVESEFQRARALSVEEVGSGKFSIHDIVLPGPGFDVLYPDNDVGQFYIEFMKKPQNGGLDPHSMRRSKKDFSVSGNYRHLLGRFKGEARWEVRTYVNDSEQMRPTDRDLIDQRKVVAKAKSQETIKGHEKQTKAPELSQSAEETAIHNERRRQRESPEAEPRVNDVWAQTSEDGGSKRIKFNQDDSRPDMPGFTAFMAPGQGGAPLWQQDDTSSHQPKHAEGNAQLPLKPTRQPAVPNGSAGFALFTEPEASNAASKKPDPGTSPTSNKMASNDAPNEQTQISEPSGSLNDTARPLAVNISTHTPKLDSRLSSTAMQSFTQSDLSAYKDSDIKIAVVLEFGLVQSAYATVVLRELMAEVEPEQPGSPLYPHSL